MKKSNRIDLGRLLGFDAVAQEVSGDIELQSEAIDAKLGAKVGAEAWIECEVMTSQPLCEGVSASA